MKTTKQELEETRKKLKELEEKYKQEMGMMSPLRPVAEKVHEVFCGYNHEQICSWNYEEGLNINNEDSLWTNDAHKDYLNRVELFLSERIVSLESLEKFLDEMIKLKKIFPFWNKIIRHFTGECK